jgi:hypothetical protein
MIGAQIDAGAMFQLPTTPDIDSSLLNPGPIRISQKMTQSPIQLGRKTTKITKFAQNLCAHL